MNRSHLLLLLAAPLSVVAKDTKYLTFIDVNMQDFCNRLVPADEQTSFMTFFSAAEDKLAKLESQQQHKRKHSLYCKALKSLDSDHAAWANQINFFLKDAYFLVEDFDAERAQVREFLQRYGIYKEYKDRRGINIAQRVSGQDSVWKNIKTKVVSVTNKVGNWFKSIGREATA